MRNDQIIPELQNILGEVAELQERTNVPFEISTDERADLLDAIIVLYQIYHRNRKKL